MDTTPVDRWRPVEMNVKHMLFFVIANTIVAAIIGQGIISAGLDHRGLLGLSRHPALIYTGF